jgi:hypothetical protein
MLRCYKHYGVETLLKCGSCERSICVKCVVQHPVGIRCNECTRIQKLPIFDVTPIDWAKAIAVTLGIGVFGACVLAISGLLILPLGFMSIYVSWLVLLGVGYMMGSGVKVVLKGKRGRGLQWIVGIGTVITGIVGSAFGLEINSVFGLLVLGAAVYMAVVNFRI